MSMSSENNHMDFIHFVDFMFVDTKCEASLIHFICR